MPNCNSDFQNDLKYALHSVDSLIETINDLPKLFPDYVDSLYRLQWELKEIQYQEQAKQGRFNWEHDNQNYQVGAA